MTVVFWKYKYGLIVVFMLTLNTVMAQLNYKNDFDKIKKAYDSLVSYQVAIEFNMYDLNSMKLLQKMKGNLLQNGDNKYFQSTETELVVYNTVAVDVYHEDKTIVVSKPQKSKVSSFIPYMYLNSPYVKVTGGEVANNVKNYIIFFTTGLYSKVQLSFDISTFYVTSVKLYDMKSNDIEEPVIIEIKYGPIKPLNALKTTFPIEKFVRKELSGYTCQPAYSNYELIDNTY